MNPRARAERPLFAERGRAESFGAVAQLYDRSRPSYPTELVDFLVRDRPRRVLDVGCGTGIAAVLLAARGCRVLASSNGPTAAGGSTCSREDKPGTGSSHNPARARRHRC